MDDGSWKALGALYKRAKEGDEVAWGELQERATKKLADRLRRMSPGLPPWVIEDISHDANLYMIMKAHAIPSWPQAWRFAFKAALGLLEKYLRKPLSNLSEFEPPHPGSSNSFRAVDDFDELEAIIETMKEKRWRLVLGMCHCIAAGKVPTLGCLARREGVSKNTVERELQRMRAFFRFRGTKGDA